MTNRATVHVHGKENRVDFFRFIVNENGLHALSWRCPFENKNVRNDAETVLTKERLVWVESSDVCLSYLDGSKDEPKPVAFGECAALSFICT